MNKRKLILYIAASLDGYIATEDHSLDWLFKTEGEDDNGFSKFYDTVDTIFLGRTTYEWILAHEKNDFPYKDKECYVFTRSIINDTEYVKFINSDITFFTKDIKNKEGGSIWIVGGGELIHSFIKKKLVDEIIITIAPVLLGKGIPLFKNQEFQTLLELKKTQCYNQFVELYYTVMSYGGK
jgi:dihydrofolate reductase